MSQASEYLVATKGMFSGKKNPETKPLVDLQRLTFKEQLEKKIKDALLNKIYSVIRENLKDQYKNTYADEEKLRETFVVDPSKIYVDFEEETQMKIDFSNYTGWFLPSDDHIALKDRIDINQIAN